MKRLNLVNPNDILSCKFEVSKFPDGQQSINILDGEHYTLDYLGKQEDPIEIWSRLNNFQDLELIICANQALKELGVKSVKLFIPYCTGGRSDRKFQKGGINYIKHVIAPIINSQNFDEVIIMDPHSDVLEGCINNFGKYTNYAVVKFALDDIKDLSNVCLVSPDAGAYKKVFDVATWFSIERIITATKVRDIKTGKILRTEVPVLDQENDLKYVIVDDICDGGRTFIELAKIIRQRQSNAEIYLVVTHGIFSSNFDGLSEYIDGIYTTNSVRDIQPGVDCPLIGEKSYVKQLNIF